MPIKSSILGLVVPIGNPRYVKGRDSGTHPNMVEISRHLSGEMFIGGIDDLLKLMKRPVEDLNCSSRDLSLSNWMGQASKVIRVSSAY
jgi:hypothetical protein